MRPYLSCSVRPALGSRGAARGQQARPPGSRGTGPALQGVGVGGGLPGTGEGVVGCARGGVSSGGVCAVAGPAPSPQGGSRAGRGSAERGPAAPSPEASGRRARWRRAAAEARALPRLAGWAIRSVLSPGRACGTRSLPGPPRGPLRPEVTWCSACPGRGGLGGPDFRAHMWGERLAVRFPSSGLAAAHREPVPQPRPRPAGLPAVGRASAGEGLARGDRVSEDEPEERAGEGSARCVDTAPPRLREEPFILLTPPLQRNSSEPVNKS